MKARVQLWLCAADGPQINAPGSAVFKLSSPHKVEISSTPLAKSVTQVYLGIDETICIHLLLATSHYSLTPRYKYVRTWL